MPAITYADFPSGEISERIVNTLLTLPLPKLAKLVETKVIKVPKRDTNFALHLLTYQNLRWDLIDDYAQACNVPAKYLLYGDNYPAQTYYSCFDKEVITLLNALPVTVVNAAAEVMRNVYPKALSEIPLSNTPSEKLLALCLSNGRLPDLVPEEELERYKTAINDEILRLRQYRRKERFVFHLNYILDMCTYCHISPHWVFSLNGQLLCDTPEADLFFDYFCLLSRQQQLCVLSMLLTLSKSTDSTLNAEMSEQVAQLIAREGGISLCR